MGSERESKYLQAKRLFPWLGEKSISEYTSLRSPFTPDTLTGYKLTPEEEFCLWVWEDARDLSAEFLSTPPDVPTEDFYERYFDENLLEKYSPREFLHEHIAARPNRLRLRYFANRVFFRDKVKSTFPMHLAGALGLVAVGLAIEDPHIQIDKYREIVDEYIQGKKQFEIQFLLSSLGEPLSSQFQMAGIVFQKNMESGDLDPEEKMFKQQVEYRYGSIRRYMRNLLLAAEYISRAQQKLQPPPNPISSPSPT